jgi:uncharacterized membrane protein SirB2
VDTVLLASAIAMAVISAQYPFAADWLTAKLVGLLIYIGCGSDGAQARARQTRSARPSWSPRCCLCLHRVGCADAQPAGLRSPGSI